MFDQLVQNTFAEGDDFVDFSAASAEEQETHRALLRSIITLAPGYARDAEVLGSLWTFLKFPPLAELIKSRPQEAERIVMIVNERELDFSAPKDIDGLCALLDQQPLPALGSGVL